MQVKYVKLCVLTFMLASCVWFGATSKADSTQTHDKLTLDNVKKVNTGMADSAALLSVYKNWSKTTNLVGLKQPLTISVGWVRGMSSEKTSARGQVSINFEKTTVDVAIQGLSDGNWDVWLIDNGDNLNNSSMPGFDDNMLNIGQLVASEKGEFRLSTMLPIDTFSNFEVDRVAITKTGETPAQDFVITGAPTLFQKISSEKYKTTRKLKHALDAFISNKKNVSPISKTEANQIMDSLIARGREVFVNETFNGNGRTCNTCHREDNNFTIDPAFIATLPLSDPLFVAETNPALAMNFEKPDMLRKFGLFIENVDGLDDLANKFVLRSANHLLALSTNITPPSPGLLVDFASLTPTPPVQRLGWGGDGSTGSGSLREFAIGAIIQHFPKTLGRKSGMDFRLPTDEELDALEAFQLSLGRHEDLDLNLLTFRDPIINNGKNLFTGAAPNDGGVTKKCTICHFNAGATVSIALTIDPFCVTCFPFGMNGSFATSLEVLPDVKKFNLPPDGGFGLDRTPAGEFGNCISVPFIGQCTKEFRIPPIIEAADTGPFFHHHLIDSVEGSVDFYGSDTFNKNGAGTFEFPPGNRLAEIKLNTQEVNAMGAFMRVINIVENIRSAITLEQKATQQTSMEDSKDLIRLAIAEVDDALEVLDGGLLRTRRNQEETVGPLSTSLLRLRTAKSFLMDASITSDRATMNSLVQRAISQKRAVRDILVKADTLPRSFQN